MINRESVLGENIICSKSGIGKIVEITSLYEGGEEFYKVSFPEQKCVNYFSMKNRHSYRILASKKIINKAINIFKSEFEKDEYSSTQERINTQKEMLKESDICKLAKTLSVLNNEKNLHAQISKPFKDSLESFVNEVIFVLDLQETEAYSLLGLKAPVKKVKQ